MLLIENHAGADAVPSERLSLAFEARTKSRLRTRLDSGEEAWLFLERGSVLRGGDKLAAKDGRIVLVVAAAEELMEAMSADPRQLARAAYHLGNRHVAVELGEGRLRFAADHVLGDMVAGLGLPVTRIVAPFEPESGAYGSGHGGHGEHGNHGGGAAAAQPRPRIHDPVAKTAP